MDEAGGSGAITKFSIETSSRDSAVANLNAPAPNA